MRTKRTLIFVGVSLVALMFVGMWSVRDRARRGYRIPGITFLGFTNVGTRPEWRAIIAVSNTVDRAIECVALSNGSIDPDTDLSTNSLKLDMQVLLTYGLINPRGRYQPLDGHGVRSFLVMGEPTNQTDVAIVYRPKSTRLSRLVESGKTWLNSMQNWIYFPVSERPAQMITISIPHSEQ